MNPTMKYAIRHFWVTAIVEIGKVKEMNWCKYAADELTLGSVKNSGKEYPSWMSLLPSGKSMFNKYL